MTFELDEDFVRDVFTNPAVVDELERIAQEEVLPRAASLAAASGLSDFAASLRVETGVRPKGRSYARVIADHDDAQRLEFGDSKTRRYRVLGRSANVHIWPDT